MKTSTKPAHVLPACATTEELISALAALGVTPATLTPGMSGTNAFGAFYTTGKGRWKKQFLVRWEDMPIVGTNYHGEVRRAPF